MIKGCNYWDDTNLVYHSQTNNIVEKYYSFRQLSGSLETCGASAFSNCVSSKLGKDALIYKNYIEISLDDAVTSLLLKQFPNDDYPTRTLSNYINIYNKLYGRPAVGYNKKDFDFIKDQILNGNPVQICLLNPGHYLAAVAYDDSTDKFICYDSWSNRTNSKIVRVDREEYKNNVAWVFNVYY